MGDRTRAEETSDMLRDENEELMKERDELRRRVSKLERINGEYRATMNTYWGMNPRWTQVPPLLIKLKKSLESILNYYNGIPHPEACGCEPSENFQDPDCAIASTVTELLGSFEFEGDPLELVADQVHQQWAGWTRYFLSKTYFDPAHPSKDYKMLDASWVDRAQRQIDTPYAGLSEEKKEADRREARKILEALEVKWTP